MLDRRSIAIIFAITILLLLYLLHQTDNLDHNKAIALPHQTQDRISTTCPSPRLKNLHHITPPTRADPAILRSLWLKVKDIFDDHPPTPGSVPKNGFGSGDIEGMPPPEFFKAKLSITDDDAAKTRKAHEEVVHKLPGYPHLEYSGRGIVMLAGARYSAYAATSLGVLREVGSKLPVEVWYKDSSEDTAGWCEELATEGMACRELADYLDMEALEEPYSWKVLTILLSSFEEIIFLDADSMPLKDPDDIFESERYRDTGAIVFPDYWLNTGSPRTRYIIGQTEMQEDDSWLLKNRTVDSGQLIWNKKQHWKSLLLATYYNYYGYDFYYSLLNNGWDGWGDKDTFSTALISLNESFHQVPQEVGTLFIAPELVNGGLMGVAMFHTDPRCADDLDKYTCPIHPLFIHANTLKWSMRDLLDLDTSYIGHGNSLREGLQEIIHKSFEGGTRLLNQDTSRTFKHDPEALLWRAIENSACRSSVWQNESACKRVREHMTRTFGFSFMPKSGIATLIDKDKEELCVIEAEKRAR